MDRYIRKTLYKEQKLLTDCANRVKAAIGAKSGKVVFGGTSSQLVENLMMSVNSAYDKDEYDVYCSCYEHDSFFRYGDNKLLELSELDTVFDISNERRQSLVMWQGVNNITGEIFPIEQIGSICHGFNSFYICDMTAMIGKAPIPVNINQWCDCAVWSGWLKEIVITLLSYYGQWEMRSPCKMMNGDGKS